MSNRISGLLAFVLRNASGMDCSNGGLSAHFDQAILYGEGVPHIFEPNGHPAFELQRTESGYIKAVPYHRPGTPKVGWMFGGNFLYSSDSRFPSQYPIPIHDRREDIETASLVRAKIKDFPLLNNGSNPENLHANAEHSGDAGEYEELRFSVTTPTGELVSEGLVTLEDGKPVLFVNTDSENTDAMTHKINLVCAPESAVTVLI